MTSKAPTLRQSRDTFGGHKHIRNNSERDSVQNLKKTMNVYRRFKVHASVLAISSLLRRYVVSLRIRLMMFQRFDFNPLNPELNPICYLLALLAHHFLHVSRIRVKSLTLKLLMSYVYIWSAYS